MNREFSTSQSSPHHPAEAKSGSSRRLVYDSLRPILIADRRSLPSTSSRLCWCWHSALLHASWNLIVKSSQDRLIAGFAAGGLRGTRRRSGALHFRNPDRGLASHRVVELHSPRLRIDVDHRLRARRYVAGLSSGQRYRPDSGHVAAALGSTTSRADGASWPSAWPSSVSYRSALAAIGRARVGR